MKIETCFSQKPLCNFKPNFLCTLLGTMYKEMKIYEYDVGYIAKMAAKPIYGKNPLKVFFSGTGRPISTKLGM